MGICCPAVPTSWFGLLMGKRVGEGEAFFTFILLNWGCSHLVITQSAHPSLAIVMKTWQLFLGSIPGPTTLQWCVWYGQNPFLCFLKGIIIFCLTAAVRTKLDDTWFSPIPQCGLVNLLITPEHSLKVKASVNQMVHPLPWPVSPRLPGDKGSPGESLLFWYEGSFWVGQGGRLTPRSLLEPFRVWWYVRRETVKLPVPLGSLDGQAGSYQQLQQITQLAKIMEVVYKCIPVAQILLLALSFWEAGCGKEAGEWEALKLIILSYYFPGVHGNWAWPRCK